MYNEDIKYHKNMCLSISIIYSIMFSCNWKKYSSSNKIVSIQKIPNYDSDRSDKPVDSVIGTDSTNTNTNSNSVEIYINLW